LPSPIAEIKALFETHLNVRDLERSIPFYRDVLGLPLAIHLPERKVAFFWTPNPGESMVGVWETGTSPNALRLHIAFTVELSDLEASISRLQAAGIAITQGRDEPLVFAWMPAAMVSFLDPDGHLIELISMLPDPPRPELGLVRLSEWRALQTTSNEPS
jgi:catechol 2,3-dioxygenase-like lactoylglutathione lyase family enzyme